MKYGLLIDFGAPYCNYGDYVQSIAIEYLYKLMNIPENEIVHITQKQLATYDGEQLLLPYSYVLHFLVNPKDGSAKISSKITPVFLGASMSFAMLITSYPIEKFFLPGNKWEELFSSYAPIGCRDEFTRKFIAAMGIPAYLQGCITNILPRRQDRNYKKILLVDCPSEVLPYIPKKLLIDAEAMSNTIYNKNLSSEENYSKIKNRYKYYRDNAALVVTSRYHVATPCNAMGIPSIFIMHPSDKNSEDVRLDTLNPNIQLCSSENYSNINWYPQWKDSSDLKSNIIKLAIIRIQEAYERYTRSRQITKFFHQRIDEYKSIKKSQVSYKTKLYNYIEINHALPENSRFYIWGAIPLLCDGKHVILADLIKKINPNLDFAGWIDTYKSGTLAGKPIFKPDKFSLADDEFVIVAAETAVPDALNCFSKMCLNRKQYLILANTNKIITNSDLKK